MKMTTNFDLMDELMVAPTYGLDGEDGLVRIVAVTVWAGLPVNQDRESWLSGHPQDDAEFTGATWYGFMYVDQLSHEAWGVMYLPEGLLEDMVKAAKRKAARAETFEEQMEDNGGTALLDSSAAR